MLHAAVLHGLAGWLARALRAPKDNTNNNISTNPHAGYMFRNAWYRLELRKSMGGAGALAAAAGGAGGPGRSRAAELVGSSVAEGSVDDDYRPTPQYAPGSQMRG